MRAKVLCAAVFLLLGACGFLPPTYAARPDPIKISPETWAAYQAYLTVLGDTGRGVFAIAEDGAGGESWVCASAGCVSVDTYAARAISRCQETNPGYSCIVFAVDRQPQVPFTQPQ